MAKKKKLNFGEGISGRTMKKLYVEYLIPGMINEYLGHIEFLKKMSERLKSDLAKEGKPRLTGTEVMLKQREFNRLNSIEAEKRFGKLIIYEGGKKK